MLYFSLMSGKKVFDKDGICLGKLYDLLFLPIETPLITKVVIKNKKGEKLIAPIQHLKPHTTGGFLLQNSFTPQEKTEKEASILKNIQDKQIIDLKGEKIIRANDIAIQDQPGYVISGIDIGVFGVFRWIGIARMVGTFLNTLGIKYRSGFLPWDEVQPLEITRGKIVLKEEKEKLNKLLPEDLADYLEKTTTVNALKVLKFMDPEMSAEVLADINIGFQSELFRRFTPKKSAELLSLMDPDEAVDILLTLNDEKREEILELIGVSKQKDLIHLLKFAKTPIGGLMTTEFLSVDATDTIKVVMQKLKKTSDFVGLHYIYVVNKDSQLVGVIDLHDLFLYPSTKPVYAFMVTNVVLLRLTTPKEIAVQKMLKYHLASLPVVDEDRKILGSVTLDDVAEEILAKVK